MATTVGVSKILSDGGLIITGGASTVLGTAMAKGTATDLLLSVITSAGQGTITGSVALTVQGSNINNTTLSNWTAVVADKGTAVNPSTTTGIQNLHFAQLQYAFYRLYCVASTTATQTFVTVYNFQPMADSFDASVG